MKNINSQPAVAGLYSVSWSEEVTRSAVVEILPEDCDGSDDMQDALISAIENGGHPDRMETSVEHQDDFYVYEKVKTDL